MIDNLQIDLFVWWQKWGVVEKPVNPWMDSVWSVWEIGTITVVVLAGGGGSGCCSCWRAVTTHTISYSCYTSYSQPRRNKTGGPRARASHHHQHAETAVIYFLIVCSLFLFSIHKDSFFNERPWFWKEFSRQSFPIRCLCSIKLRKNSGSQIPVELQKMSRTGADGPRVTVAGKKIKFSFFFGVKVLQTFSNISSRRTTGPIQSP